MSRSTFQPSEPAAVEYHAEGDRWTLVFVRVLRHAPDRVWEALTEPEQLAEWAPYATDRDLGSTGDATLTMIDGETAEELATHVARAERPRLLEYSWGDDLLRWELAPEGAGTRLTLRHTLADEGFVPKVAAGWHLCLDVAERLLDGQPIAPIRGQDALNYGWQELHDTYAEQLGVLPHQG
jgi:uncharacterized protein YndB with AHSA1/START domain